MAKPIKRSPGLAQFSKDHHFGLLLVWKIRQGLPLNIAPFRIGQYINFFFENYLIEHFKEEEKLLFGELDRNDDLRVKAENDHATLLRLDQEIKIEPTAANLKEFADKLEEHIRFEERSLFAHLENIIEQSRLDSIAEKMQETHPMQKEDNWNDVFWMEKNS